MIQFLLKNAIDKFIESRIIKVTKEGFMVRRLHEHFLGFRELYVIEVQIGKSMSIEDEMIFDMQ